MFSRRSRYRQLPDVVTIDARDRSLPSKTLRLLPEVTGRFLHTIEEVDRLDHLAYKYYRQPSKWWRICDANPDIMSPQALLGKEPLVTERFPLTLAAGSSQPPWAALRQILEAQVGVMAWHMVEDWQLMPQIQTVDDQQVRVLIDYFERAVVVTYNQMNLKASSLAAAMEASGFEVGQAERSGRIGKQITIPPDITG